VWWGILVILTIGEAEVDLGLRPAPGKSTWWSNLKNNKSKKGWGYSRTIKREKRKKKSNHRLGENTGKTGIKTTTCKTPTV
jgi:hypothetical protein